MKKPIVNKEHEEVRPDIEDIFWYNDLNKIEKGALRSENVWPF